MGRLDNGIVKTPKRFFKFIFACLAFYYYQKEDALFQTKAVF